MYNIELLAKLAGLTRRTIRYYIQIGLLPPPNGNCRGSYYTEEHLNKLEEIKNWSKQGVPLNQIKGMFEGEVPAVKVDLEHIVCTVQWERLELHEGVELHFRSNYFRADELKKISDFINEILSCKNTERNQ